MQNIKDAVYLIDDDSTYGWGGLRTHWDFISYGSSCGGADGSGWRINADGSGSAYLRRDCNRFEGGALTLEAKVRSLSGDGLRLCLGSRTAAFITLHTVGERLFAGELELCPFEYGEHYIVIRAELDSASADIIVDSRLRGRISLDGELFFDCLRFGYDKGAVGSAVLDFVKLYVNFIFNDCNLNPYSGELPDAYSVTAPTTSSVTSDLRVEGKNDYTYISRNAAGDTTSTLRAFSPADGIVVYEMMYLMTEKKGRFAAALIGNGLTAISVWDEGELLYSGGTELRAHHINVWQTLRIEADTDEQTAKIWLNGKLTQTLKFETAVPVLDAVRIVYEAYEESSLMFSDMRAWIKPEEPEDYVPAPIPPKKKGDYVVGMNICSLWREGTHFGWDVISPFDDLKPVLGYYDEGLPETSDWEIKYMVEHGIDYELYCWYSSEVRAPIKTTHLHHAWLDGHFYAKYADMEKFALLWEAANCSHPTCLDDFKQNLVPYWLDYFFSDPRYMRIDNKAIMSCFGVWCVERDLGGEACVREGLQYLRDEVKKLGYDDLIVMGCHANPRDLKRLGFDAFHAYHWGADGYKLETNIKSNNDNIAQNAVHIVPTVSVGFKNIGWGGARRPNLAVQDMYNGLKYCMDELLPKFEHGTWKSRLLHLSTWNEYGEGTYMMPSGLNGFGYLDAVRRAVCEDEPHTDIIPTDRQRARICNLRVQSRHKLARTKYDERPLPDTDMPIARYEFKTQADMDKWSFGKMSEVELRDGCLCGRASEPYPVMELVEPGIDAAQVAYAKVIMTNRHADNNAPTVAYFAPTSRPERDDYDIHHRAASFWCNAMERKEYRFDLDNQYWWTGNIHGIRFIPTYSGSFELESITLYAGVPHTTVYGKNGRQLFFGDYIEKKNGSLCIPLDPDSGLLRELDLKFEWFKEDGRLELYREDSTVVITVGQAYATKNGESYTLIRPAYLKDGIPTLTLEDLAALLGISYEIEQDKLYLK